MNIKTYREVRGWTQEHLALAAGISTRTIQRIEAGQPASLETMLALAGALDIDTETLIGSVPEGLQIRESTILLPLDEEEVEVHRIQMWSEAEIAMAVIAQIPKGRRLFQGGEVPRDSKVIFPNFQFKDGLLLGEEHEGPTDPETRLREVIAASRVNGYGIFPGHPGKAHVLWVTQEGPHLNPGHHAMAWLPYEFYLDDILLMAPLKMLRATVMA